METILNRKEKRMIKSKLKKSGIMIKPSYFNGRYLKQTSKLPKFGETDVLTPNKLVTEMWTILMKHFKNNSYNIKVLDSSCGRGSFLIKAYEILFNEIYSDIENIDFRNKLCIDSLYGVDINSIYVQVVKKELEEIQKYYGATKILKPNIYNKEFLNTDINMKFDIVIGNPPYQNGPDKLFYIKFISKGLSLLKSNGIMSFINPYSWVDKSVFNSMKKDGYFHLLKQVDGDEIFKISMGSPLCTFVYEKDASIKGCSKIEMHPKFKKDEFALQIISKILKNSIKPIKGKGQPGFIKNKTNNYKYPVYLSSKNTKDDNRTMVWSDKPEKGTNVDKLIVAHILVPGKTSMFSEFSKEKGVGRYSQYFECDLNESINIKSFFNSDIYKFIDLNMRVGRYAHLEIPNIDWSLKYSNESIYSILTKKEIDYIKNAVN